MTVPTGAGEADTADGSAGSPSDQPDRYGFEVDFLPTDFRVGQMRRITSAHLRLWGLTVVCEAATLVVSELVTNAVRHGRGNPVGFRVISSDGELRIEVTDGNPAPARLRNAGEAAENGRGLLLIAALAKEWGVSPDGRMTWCSLAIPEGGS
ncbi:ATP-binding protein [Streptomyces sp. S3(2020)]|uniref:ATP-binding protein n=1 Tax=Streptomyces sp. S3(2020) TaxID=2732044 RepID=UPI00148849E8|nr:ATP-binding protein [Streptomyces sp. S3(2020)]NNN34641.1 ATP-binding protein [Streptomyces sp. S3(2020)]